MGDTAVPGMHSRYVFEAGTPELCREWREALQAHATFAASDAGRSARAALLETRNAIRLERVGAQADVREKAQADMAARNKERHMNRVCEICGVKATEQNMVSFQKKCAKCHRLAGENFPGL